jgi:2-phosphosulfolactate phosphatase
MRVDVALTPADAPGSSPHGHTAIVIDVLRATTTVVAACQSGCRRVIPVGDVEAAMAAAAEFPRDQVVLGGERGGEPIAGFDLGNSPLDYTPARVGGRTIVLTTTNGTTTMKSATRARSAAVAALVNVRAAADWALARRDDLTVLCSGDVGALSLEDAVCAGLLVRWMLERATGLELSGAAVMALRLAEYYGDRLADVRRHSRWARRLAAKGLTDDIDACLRLDTTSMVPVFQDGAIVPGPLPHGAADGDAVRSAPEAAR